MATANDLITRALRRARVIGKDQVPTADESADALAALNSMLDLWWNERLMVYQVVQENFALVAGQASRTIGAGGNFNTTRPVKIERGSFVRRDGQDHQLIILEDRADYDAIGLKTATGLPKAIFYDPAYPLGTLYFYYVPDAADTLYLNSWKRLQSLAALVTAVALPPGYDDLIVDGLAIKVAPEYGVECPASVQKNFGITKRVLKRPNSPAMIMDIDPSLLPRHKMGYNIYSDS